MDLSAVCDCGISIILNFECFQTWAEMLYCRVASHVLVCRVMPNICQKHVHGLPDLPHSDYPFKFFG